MNVTRYTCGVIQEDGAVGFTTARQGQYMKATQDEARKWRDALVSNNHPKTLLDAFGTDDHARFVVCSVECYPVHHDPVDWPVPIETATNQEDQ